MQREPDENNRHDLNDKIAEYVLNALQQAINDGVFGEARMVQSALCVVECLDEDGDSRLSVIITDKRLTTNLGLVNYGSLWVASNVGGAG